MANASEPGGGGGGAEAAALGLRLATLSLLLCVSLAGNVLFALLIVRERSLHRAPYYLLPVALHSGLYPWSKGVSFLSKAHAWVGALYIKGGGCVEGLAGPIQGPRS